MQVVLTQPDKLIDVPLLEAEGPREAVHFRGIVEGLRYFDKQRGRRDWPFVIGVSGGIDSAVVLCLLEQAVGADRVRAFNLPGPFNSDATREAARLLCERLGIAYREIPISPIAEAVRSTLAEAGIAPNDFHFENIQAKVRGTDILSNIAGILGGLLTNNGNKVEATLGYATLYGDTNGAVCPIGDLTKLEVWALARHLNETVYRRETIPDALIPARGCINCPIPPSAELAPAQVDPMKWGYHDALTSYFWKRGTDARELIEAWHDRTLAAWLSRWNGLTEERNTAILHAFHLDHFPTFREDIDWFFHTAERMAFKRQQLPPVIAFR